VVTIPWGRARSQPNRQQSLPTELRDSGATIIESLKVVREIEQVNLGQAKLIVDQSATWRDAYAANRALRDEIVRAIDSADD
jgi:ribosomal protein L7/L12